MNIVDNIAHGHDGDDGGIVNGVHGVTSDSDGYVGYSIMKSHSTNRRCYVGN